MEQERRQNQIQQAQQTPLKCPRCDSTDTIFRYFNNHSLAQPRHYCRTCKRLWTVGGSIRDIPVGGNSRNKPNRVLSCRHGGESSSQPQPPFLPSMVPQILDVTGIQPVTNLPQPIAPLNSFYFNNEFPNLDAIDSQIQPDVANQTVNVGSADMSFQQDWNIQSIAEQQALPERIPGYNDQFNVVDPGMVELNQLHGQTGFYPVSNYDLVQPDWPMNFMPQETTNNFSVSTSDACLWDNSSGNITNMEMPTTSANPNDWLDFPDYGPP